MGSEGEYRLIWFQHLHKSAGTLIVNMAINNNEVLFDNHNNGNPTNSIGEVLPIWEYSKNQLLDFVNECEISGITFVATEYGAPNFKLLSKDSRVELMSCFQILKIELFLTLIMIIILDILMKNRWKILLKIQVFILLIIIM